MSTGIQSLMSAAHVAGYAMAAYDDGLYAEDADEVEATARSEAARALMVLPPPGRGHSLLLTDSARAAWLREWVASWWYGRAAA